MSDAGTHTFPLCLLHTHTIEQGGEWQLLYYRGDGMRNSNVRVFMCVHVQRKGKRSQEFVWRTVGETENKSIFSNEEECS